MVITDTKRGNIISSQTTEQVATRKIAPVDAGDHVDRWLAIAVIAVIAALVVVGALIIAKVYLQTPVMRTALERELITYQMRLEKKPGDLDARVAIAQVYVRMGDTRAAKEELNKALDIDPNYWSALYQLGQVYLKNHQKKLAIVQFEKAVKAKPDDELAYFQLGILAYKDKQYARAIDYLETTVKISPLLADAHYYLGSSYEHQGDKEVAKRQYEEALKYIPDYAPAKEGLARVQP